MKIETCTFEDVLPVWRDHLWPGRESAIRAQSSMLLNGGYDKAIYEREVYFYSVKESGRIIGVNSIFETAPGEYRSRGLFVFPEVRGHSLGQLLLKEAVQFAQSKNARRVWSLPRVAAFPTYERVGFKKLRSANEQEMEFGPNVYAVLEL